MKRLFILILIALGFFGVERLCHRATDGFALVNVIPPKGEYTQWHRECPIPSSLLEQTFTYYACGSQSYVFVSDDGKTVLKLFKFQHMRTPPILDWIPLKEKRAKKRRVLEKTFDSLSLAYDQMREETGLIALHLTETQGLYPSITLIDKIGKHHRVNLDRTPFLLQKKGTLVFETIKKWMENGEKEKAETGLQTLLRLAVSRCQKGLFDKDPDFATNFGFVEEIPFQLDFGRLSISPEEADRAVFAPEMIRITRELESWIAENYPDLLDSFTEELNEITSL